MSRAYIYMEHPETAEVITLLRRAPGAFPCSAH